MKAMIIQKFGSSNVFEPAEITKPEVKPGHVLVSAHPEMDNFCLLSEVKNFETSVGS